MTAYANSTNEYCGGQVIHRQKPSPMQTVSLNLSNNFQILMNYVVELLNSFVKDIKY